MRIRSIRGSALVAAVLSFIVPGLGQAAAGRPRRAVIVAIPAFVALVVGVWLLVFDRHWLIDASLDPGWLTAFLVVDAVALVYHLAAVFDAFRIAGGSLRPQPTAVRARFLAVGMLVVLVATTAGIHGALAAIDVQAQDAINSVFDPNGPSWFADNETEPPANETEPPIDEEEEEEESPEATETPAPTDSPSPTDSASPTDSPSPSPTATPTKAPSGGGNKIPVYPVEPMPPSTGGSTHWPDDGMLNVVLIGSDAGAGRWSLRTDTMILLTVDLKTGRAAMYGIPRNVYNVPLGAESAAAFSCHCFPYPNMLNALYRYAMDHPKYFPGGNVRGFKAVEGAIGALTKTRVDGSVVVNLMGFVKLVNALGGVDVNVPTRLVDNHYVPENNGPAIKLNISAGMHHFDGHMALAYARSRHMDSDYGRMKRQQLVLLSLRKTIDHPCSLVSRVPSILSAIKGTFWTDLPLSAAPQLLAIANKVGASNTASFTFTPPTYPEFYTQATVNKIRSVVAHGLDRVPAAGNTGTGSGFSC